MLCSWLLHLTRFIRAAGTINKIKPIFSDHRWTPCILIEMRQMQFQCCDASLCLIAMERCIILVLKLVRGMCTHRPIFIFRVFHWWTIEVISSMSISHFINENISIGISIDVESFTFHPFSLSTQPGNWIMLQFIFKEQPVLWVYHAKYFPGTTVGCAVPPEKKRTRITNPATIDFCTPGCSCDEISMA